jgi:hypothetical protein
MSPAVGDIRRPATKWFPLSSLLASLKLGAPVEKGKTTMTKTIDTITEIVRNPKHSFRKADGRPVKAQKHRYQRRKVREYLRLGDWAQENSA